MPDTSAGAPTLVQENSASATETPPASPIAIRARTSTRKGKVARLPKEIRDQLNQMLLDGIPYSQIIKRLGEPAGDLTTNNISNWKTDGGFDEFLLELQRRDECRHRKELFQNLAADHPGTDAYQAAPKVAVGLACEALIDLGPGTLQRALNQNPLNAFRLLNALSRILSGGLKCERLLDELAELKARQLQTAQPNDNKGLSDENFDKINTKLNLM